MIDWSKMVSTDGGYMYLEDYCNARGPRGVQLGLASRMVLADEELLALEIGDRALSHVLDENVVDLGGPSWWHQ